MPRLRPRGVLERSAIANLFKHTLSRIPTSYGKLAYLASLRDQNSGNYRHHGLFSTFGREESTMALEQSHTQVFSEWLAFSMERKHADLREYLSGLEDTEKEVLTHLSTSQFFRTYVPAKASAAERDLFSKEVEILVEIMKFEA